MAAPIHLIPVGAPDNGAFIAIAEALAEAFDAVVEMSERALSPRPAYDAKRGQHSSRLILQSLLDAAPPPDRVVGVTDVDLFMPILTFVFGEAQLGGRAAVVSLHRLHQSFYGLPDSLPYLHDRAIKEALHEVGHTYGLIHCPDYRCVMTASRVVEEIDLKGAEFCTACQAKIALSNRRHTR